MKREEFIQKSSDWGKKRVPYFFLMDFEAESPHIFKLEDAIKEGVLVKLPNYSNVVKMDMPGNLNWGFDPLPFKEYLPRFQRVYQHLIHGDSYLTNLTFPTRVRTNKTLKEIFNLANAPFKLLYKDKFAVFSPERFIKIVGNEISTFPMKGTLEVSNTNSEYTLLENSKEEWEHNTVVDLLRNDLSIVSKKVRVVRYRYPERVLSKGKEIIQTSSEIQGILPENWNENLGEILLKLVPAGSVSGAPKRKTVEIIKSCELDSRGYYCGIFGVFDGYTVESAVSIRFLEQIGEDLFFRSGGGITAQSSPEEEYEELLTKVYVPVI